VYPLTNHTRRTGSWFAITGIVFLLLISAARPANATETIADARATAGVNGAASESSSKPGCEGAGGQPIADETLLLDVRINGNASGKVGEFVMRHGTLMVRPSELRDLGFRISDSLIQEGRDMIALSDVRGLSWNLDEKNMVMNITVGDDMLIPTEVQTFGQQSALSHREIQSGTGVTVNYDALGTFSGSGAGLSGSTDFRVFSPKGIASSTWLGFAGSAPGNSSGARTVRLDSAYTFADVNSLRRYSVGDYITSGLSWTRPIRMGGAQVRSDFSMRPDLVTFPLPTIKGSTAVPSTVEVLANENVSASSHVAPGPFQVSQLPVVSGAGTISMTMTDALGQQVTTTQPFYASTELLAPGLKTYAVQAGAVRRNWGASSNDYGKLAGSATYRRGLTPTFTLEGSAEATSGTVQAGAGGVKQIGHLGVVNFATAGSSGWGHSGGQVTAGAQRIGRTFSLGGSATLATRDYRDVAAMNGDGVMRKQISAFTGLNLKHVGSVGAVYAEIARDLPPAPTPQGIAPAQHSRVVSANYSHQFHRISFYASAFKDFSHDGSNGLQFGVTFALGRRSSASVTGTSEGSAQVQVQKSAALVGDWGYNGYLATGNSNHTFGQVQYKSPVGLFTAGVDQSAGNTSARLEAQGAVSVTDGAVFPSNTIYDSFAVVDTGSVPHVHVLQENREVGKTNSSGRLLVPDMRAFDLNHLAIAATDIPADVTLDTDTREIRPQDRSGVVVKFPVKVSHSALLKLVDETGQPLELGSVATLHATGAEVPIGYDGEAYIADLSQHNELSVERKDGQRCTVKFDYKPVAGDIPSIGPLRCAVKENRP
jgi:outer membrane usher protein